MEAKILSRDRATVVQCSAGNWSLAKDSISRSGSTAEHYQLSRGFLLVLCREGPIWHDMVIVSSLLLLLDHLLAALQEINTGLGDFDPRLDTSRA